MLESSKEGVHICHGSNVSRWHQRGVYEEQEGGWGGG